MRPEQPVLLRADGDRAALSTIGGVVTVLCILLGALVVGLRHPSAPAERMVLLQPPVSPVAQQQPARAAVPRPVAATALPRLGDWTPQLGVQVARRAAKWLGWPYSFGAGNGSGPTYGHAVDADSRNDGSVFGFDCSGLVMYALSPWRGLPHSAAAQYHAAGAFHPALDQLQPGDLIFWSPDGTVNAIGHVAVYVGNGQVVQAPRSGLDVMVTPLYAVESGYMGATRPLT